MTNLTHAHVLYDPDAFTFWFCVKWSDRAATPQALSGRSHGGGGHVKSRPGPRESGQGVGLNFANAPLGRPMGGVSRPFSIRSS
jgi:hypothetical protein